MHWSLSKEAMGVSRHLIKASTDIDMEAVARRNDSCDSINESLWLSAEAELTDSLTFSIKDCLVSYP